MDHVVEETDARIDGDFLRSRLLRRMVFVNLLAFAVEVRLVVGSPEVAVLVGGKVAAVEVDRNLDLGFVGVAVEGAGARHCGG